MCMDDQATTTIRILECRGFEIVGPHGLTLDDGKRAICKAPIGETRLFNRETGRVADVSSLSVAEYDARDGTRARTPRVLHANFIAQFSG